MLPPTIGVERVKGVPPRVRLADAVRAQAQVNMLEVFFIHVDAGKALRRSDGRGALRPSLGKPEKSASTFCTRAS